MKLASTAGTVMVVDDDSLVRSLVTVLFRRMRYFVLTASGAAEALELARLFKGPIDLLVTDIQMPGVSGTEMARTFQTLRPNTKVLVVSGNDPNEEDLDPSWLFLSKPFDHCDLKMVVDGLLSPAIAAD